MAGGHHHNFQSSLTTTIGFVIFMGTSWSFDVKFHVGPIVYLYIRKCQELFHYFYLTQSY